eukprot:TRINITY_DN4159_c5_g1_i1.p1 TRINITY_DN4159_c5_g1~~TRINITY_DN4159_c5_g1_i1.p1  ORF type:complete len:404 (+),score=92.70 TRINITY_DN4159_c5_g1_i1:97-1308(+)
MYSSRMFAVSVAALLIGAVDAEEAFSNAGLTSAYEAFRAQHGHRSEEMSASVYQARLSQFAKSKAKVEAHNAQKGITWKAGLNKFSDHFDHEFKAMLGYKRMGEWWNRDDNAKQFQNRSSFLQMRTKNQKASIDWRMSLATGKVAKEQGQCGSCWAVAAVGALEMHAEKNMGKHIVPLSFKNLIDCTPNPQKCGGDGGCKGATAELAFQLVKDSGLSDAETYVGNTDQTDSCQTGLAKTVSSTGYVKLPKNKYQPLMDALSNQGPVVVSVDGGEWSMYESGVFSGCKKDATINHAVLALGYGTDKGEDYWLIRNSWGSNWGEQGFIRLKRFNSDVGDAGYCGTDYDPSQGVACKGGPKTDDVCGMCGVLYDSAYPTDVKVEGSVNYHHGGVQAAGLSWAPRSM